MYIVKWDHLTSFVYLNKTLELVKQQQDVIKTNKKVLKVIRVMCFGYVVCFGLQTLSRRYAVLIEDRHTFN